MARRVVVATGTGATVLDAETHTPEATFRVRRRRRRGHLAEQQLRLRHHADRAAGDRHDRADAGLDGASRSRRQELHDVAVTSDGTHALITDPTANRLWNVTVPGGFVNPSPTFTSPEAITVNGGTAWLTTKAATTGSLIEFNASTLATLGTDGFDGDPMAVATTPIGDYVYVSITAAGRLMAFHHTAPGTTTPVSATTLTATRPSVSWCCPTAGRLRCVERDDSAPRNWRLRAHRRRARDR